MESINTLDKVLKNFGTSKVVIGKGEEIITLEYPYNFSEIPKDWMNHVVIGYYQNCGEDIAYYYLSNI